MPASDLDLHGGLGVAWVFPGQGSQSVGMGKVLYDSYSEVRTLYQEADALLGYSISDLCFSGPSSTLQQTNHAQPALLVTELASLEALRLRYPDDFNHAEFLAGHSLGEYSALVTCNFLTFSDALRLVAERGRLMQEVGSILGQPTGMLAVIGLPDSELESVCEGAGVDLANLNAPEQVVLSGTIADLERAGALATEHGARRVVPLQVSAAFHSRLMRPMSETFAKSIEATSFGEPQMQLVANVTAAPVCAAAEMRRLLSMQTYSSVRWAESIHYIAGQGVGTFVEIGPGRVLSGLIKRIVPDAQVLSSEDLLV